MNNDQEAEYRTQCIINVFAEKTCYIVKYTNYTHM